jgi:hypothetical protein
VEPPIASSLISEYQSVAQREISTQIDRSDWPIWTSGKMGWGAPLGPAIFVGTEQDV